jgi:ribulose bisphosphate carboxylase small subunit
MGSANYIQAIRPDTAKLRTLIESSLLHDWIIDIQYQTVKSESSCWQQWKDTFFAIRSAEAVLAALTECYTKNPYSVIRISAEKVRPQSRMQYTVCNPQFLFVDDDFRPQRSTGPYPAKQVDTSRRPALVTPTS